MKPLIYRFSLKSLMLYLIGLTPSPYPLTSLVLIAAKRFAQLMHGDIELISSPANAYFRLH
ncbi:hypothetical protein ACFQNF_15255 [Iodobacter arcticus]|uniref:Uncharacterized protein n=1 Tax=Iodobacter arcticus TaxID=590593 RepID=A0ABW2R0B3_9NEIS